MTTPWKAYILITVAMMLWAAAWVAVKVLVAIAPPFTIGFFRFAVAGLLFLFAVYATGRSARNLFNREIARLVFVVGVTGIFGFSIFSLVGSRFTTAAQASIISGINPITVSLFAHIIHKERLSSRWQYLGFLFSFSGIFFIVGIQALIDFQIEYLIGNLLLISAMITWGICASVSKLAMRTMTSFELTAASVIVGASLFGLGTLTELEGIISILVNPIFWVNIIFLGVLTTFVGYLFYFEAVDKIGVTKSGVFISLVPIFGTILSILILDEPLYWTFLVGLIFVVLGILIINKPLRQHDQFSLS